MNTYNEDQSEQSEQKDLDILWTVEQTAKYLSIHPGTVYNWIGKKNVLDPKKLVRFSNRVRIPRSEVMRIAGSIKSKLEEKS